MWGTKHSKDIEVRDILLKQQVDIIAALNAEVGNLKEDIRHYEAFLNHKQSNIVYLCEKVTALEDELAHPRMPLITPSMDKLLKENAELRADKKHNLNLLSATVNELTCLKREQNAFRANCMKEVLDRLFVQVDFSALNGKPVVRVDFKKNAE